MDITVCGSGAAYAVDGSAPCTKPPPATEPKYCFVHPFHQNSGEHSQVCPPVIGQSTRLHALQSNLVGIHTGVPQHKQEVVLKYLNLSLAMAKGHMKWPHHGIRSTTPKTTTKPPSHVINSTPIMLVSSPLSVASDNTGGDWIEPQHKHCPGSNIIIEKDGNKSAANIFAFGTFANNNSSIVYHNLTGSFPFVSLEGCVLLCPIPLQIKQYNCTPNHGVKQ
jgi:hypothetical protein